LSGMTPKVSNDAGLFSLEAYVFGVSCHFRPDLHGFYSTGNWDSFTGKGNALNVLISSRPRRDTVEAKSEKWKIMVSLRDGLE